MNGQMDQPFFLRFRRPHPALGRYVREMVGFAEWGGLPWCRRELPGAFVPLILVLGEGFTLHDSEAGAPRRRLARSFLGGPELAPVFVGSAGRASCLQVNFTLAGARRFLRLDMQEVAGRIEPLEDLLDRTGRALESRLAETPDWDDRFDLLEAALLTRLDEGRAPDPTVAAALQAFGGPEGAAVGATARALGVSRRQLNRLFRRETGLTAKAAARLLRFERALARLEAGSFDSLTALAHEAGFADQAHFTRDFREIAGLSPGAFLRTVPNLQAPSASPA